MARDLDDAILMLRTNESEIGTWQLKTRGDAAAGLDRRDDLDRLVRIAGLAEERPRERRGRSVPRLQYEMLREVYDEAAFTETPVESAHRCSLFELSKERCRWPVNSEAEEFSFCGNTPLAGLPYCQGHTRLAYRSLARRAG